jgi:hypothetical protein
MEIKIATYEQKALGRQWDEGRWAEKGSRGNHRWVRLTDISFLQQLSMKIDVRKPPGKLGKPPVGAAVHYQFSPSKCVE